MSKPLVFLSHAGRDSGPARQLAEAMRRAGLRVWLDVENLEPGDRWQSVIERVVLQEADAFAVLVGRTGVRDWVDREVRLALSRNTSGQGFRVIPVIGPGADPDELPGFLDQHHWADLRDGLDDVAGLKRLAAAVLEQEPEAVSLLPEGQAPFVGLRTFDAEQAHLFFGRDDEVDALLERLRASPFLAVVGGSGSGKSSLVRAGLVPALHRGRFHDRGAWAETWQVAVLRPAADPFGELASALTDLQPDADGAERMRIRAEYARQMKSKDALHNALEVLVPAGSRMLLVVDQFEELFTQTADPSVRQRFIEELLGAARTEGDRPVHVLLTLRADFYGQCWQHPALLDRIDSNQYLVKPLAPARLRDVIEKPLGLAGVQLEPGLAERILDDAGREPGSLPLLQYALLRLWEEGDGSDLTHERYERIGRLAGALNAQAEAVFTRFENTPERQDLIRRMMLRLVQPGETTEATRKRSTRRELLALARSPEHGEVVFETLVKERLVLVQRDRDDSEDRAEIAHEALIGGWDRLAGWLDEDRKFLLWRRQFQARMATGARLTGPALGEARRWAADRAADLSQEELAFIRASVWARRGRGALGLAALAAVVASVWLGVVWGGQAERWKQLRKNFETRNYDVVWAQLPELLVSDSDIARLSTILEDELEDPAAFFEDGPAVLEPTRESSDVVLNAVEASLAVLGERATDPHVVGTMAWSLDYWSHQYPDLQDRARALRNELLDPLRNGRSPPALDQFEWIKLGAGSFERQVEEGESDESNTVTVSGFRMLAHEVTLRQYREFPGHREDEEQLSDDHPAVYVNWYEAYAYAAWLRPEGAEFCRLPTEAEWEYAARKDCEYEYCDREGQETTLDEVGWYSGNSDGPQPVKTTREHSPIGLYDMYGNVWEWCADWRAPYSFDQRDDPWGPPEGGSRVLRGGSWASLRDGARAAFRDDTRPHGRGSSLGFRVVCSSPISGDL